MFKNPFVQLLHPECRLSPAHVLDRSGATARRTVTFEMSSTSSGRRCLIARIVIGAIPHPETRHHPKVINRFRDRQLLTRVLNLESADVSTLLHFGWTTRSFFSDIFENPVIS